MPVEGGEEKEVPNSPSLKGGYRAVPGQRDLFLGYIRRGAGHQTDDTTSVEAVPVDGWTSATLGTVHSNNSAVLPGISVPRDAGAIVWSTAETVVDLYMLDNLR
jgi:hypothetical protein